MNVESNSTKNQVSISEWIANAIADTGCTVVYGGHGGALVPLVNAIVAHPQLTWVCARNEHDAATMAAAHAKLKDSLGVVIATSGPGSTNLTTGLLEAQLDQVPLLAITGLKPTAVLGYSEFQDVSQSRIFAAAGIEWSHDAASKDAVIPLLRDAVATALTRRACAHLAIPVDLQAAPSPLPLRHFCASHADVRLHPPQSMDMGQIKAAAETLVRGSDGSENDVLQTRRPRTVIAVGLRGGVTVPGMSDTLLRLAEALKAPVLTRLEAKGIVDEDHALAFGVIGVHGKPGMETAAMLISTADRVLSVGVADESLLLCNSAGLQIRRLVEVQPDAIAVGTRFNAEHTLLGNVRNICRALTEQIERLNAELEHNKPSMTTDSFRTRMASCDLDQKDVQLGKTMDAFSYMAFNNPSAERDQEYQLYLPRLEEMGVDQVYEKAQQLWDAVHKSEWTKVDEFKPNKEQTRYKFICENVSTKNYCHPASVLYALSKLRISDETDAVSRDAVVTVDVGDVTLWASLCLRLKGGSRTLYSERLGTMGYALNAGVAGILARDDPAGAVVLTGDGGFQMTLQELATFQQMKRPGDKLLVIVFDNQLLGRVIFGFENAGGCELLGPDYVALARAYGGDGILLDSDDRAEAVVKEALEKEGLYLIHVAVNPSLKADMASFKDTTLEVINSG